MSTSLCHWYRWQRQAAARPPKSIATVITHRWLSFVICESRQEERAACGLTLMVVSDRQALTSKPPLQVLILWNHRRGKGLLHTNSISVFWSPWILDQRRCAEPQAEAGSVQYKPEGTTKTWDQLYFQPGGNSSAPQSFDFDQCYTCMWWTRFCSPILYISVVYQRLRR